MVWATQNEEINRASINIEMIWNFNEEQPTDSQLRTAKYLRSEIEKKFPWIKSIKHNEVQWSPTACPWKNFDINKTKPDGKVRVEFSLSRYYAVEPNQEKYYNWRTYEEDFKMNCQWDCRNTASNTYLYDEMWGKVAACDPNLIWKKIYLEWVGEIKCIDNGWDIKNNRVDVRCGIWTKWLNRIYNQDCPTGKRMWYIIN